jgi:apolipoprotein N-acyltransferase
MMNLFFSLISGALLGLAFPKAGLSYIVFISLIPLLLAVKRAKNTKTAFFYGLLCGLVFFGYNLFWINILEKWAGSWANVAWALLIVVQALYIAVFCVLYKHILAKYPKYELMLVPLLWVLLEVIRACGPYGITGGGLGYSQTDIPIILQLAAIASSYGISFFIVLVNLSITKAFIEKDLSPLVMTLIAALLVILFGAYRLHNYHDTGRSLRVCIIQPCVPQDVKMDFGFAYNIVETHIMMSRKAAEVKPDLIIWPETAVTIYLFEARSLLAGVKDTIKACNSYFLIGTPYRAGDKIYNSVAGFSPNGETVGRYDKRRLVPFGEYLPLRPITYKILGENQLFVEDYNSNPKPQLIEVCGVKAGVVICFESTFPPFVRSLVKKGAKFIVIATNDAWFFDSSAVYQHISAAKMRAVENGVFVVQAANTGISAIIDPVGRVRKETKVNEPVVLSGEIFVH